MNIEDDSNEGLNQLPSDGVVFAETMLFMVFFFTMAGETLAWFNDFSIIGWVK